MQIIYRGAESIVYLLDFDGKKAIAKERIKKAYRIKEIDEMIRKTRTRKEVKLLKEARACGVPTPQVFQVDEKNCKIIMENVDGKRVKELIEEGKIEEIKNVCFEIGRMIGKLHSSGIVHGDPTTSNIIWKDGKPYFIDFGMGEFSRRIEDQGVDMNLLFEAIKSTHFKVLKLCWENIIKGYSKEYKFSNNVLKKVEEIEKRGRYMER